MRIPRVGRFRSTALAIIALCLLAGCGGAGPTARAVRPALTPTLPRPRGLGAVQFRSLRNRQGLPVGA